MLASGNGARVVLWRSRDGEWSPVRLPDSSQDRIAGPRLVFGPEDRYLAGFFGNTVPMAIWRIRLDDLLETACIVAGRSLGEEEAERFVGPSVPEPLVCTPGNTASRR